MLCVYGMKRVRSQSCTPTRRLRQLLLCVVLLATLAPLFLVFSSGQLAAVQLVSHGHVIQNGFPQTSNTNGDASLRIYSRASSVDNLTELVPVSHVVVRLEPRTQSSAVTVQSPTTEPPSSSTVTTHRYLTSPNTVAGASWNISAFTKSHTGLKINRSERVVTTPQSLSTSRAVHRKPTIPKNWTPICITDNCEEFLSFKSRYYAQKCLKKTLKHPNVNNVQKGRCRFLLNQTRQPVALVSAEGSGNTWLRGLLEKATGICTGFTYCDYEARARGFVGEGVNSGQVLVVKTHIAPAQWIGHEKKVDWEGQYSSAIFIIPNPAKSLIAEWNRRMTTKLMKTNHQLNNSHTNLISEDFFCKLTALI